MEENVVRFIDLFAGIGGIRKGFELACGELGLQCKCVFTSEIKPHAVDVLKQNNPDEFVYGDIRLIREAYIPDFDFLLAGFPCQAFSSAGKRLGFLDTRGTLYFEVERILKAKQPEGFILENVEGLVTHDRENKTDKMGRTLTTILQSLQNLGYHVDWRVLNSKDFGVPQDRKRIYIIGTKTEKPNMQFQKQKPKTVGDILDEGLPTVDSSLTRALLSNFKIEELRGKSIKDKRGGENNIHSWDIGLKGSVSIEEKNLLNRILTERRKKKWALEHGIEWMDGMPLTLAQIQTFFFSPDLENMLEQLIDKGYLKKEYPKKKVGGLRIQDENLAIGYNIVAGKLSYEINKILDPAEITPTLVAMDMKGLFVIDGKGLRNFSLREGLRLFGYPEDFKFNVTKEKGYDLLGNTVVVPVIKEVSKKVLKVNCSRGF